METFIGLSSHQCEMKKGKAEKQQPNSPNFVKPAADQRRQFTGLSMLLLINGQSFGAGSELSS